MGFGNRWTKWAETVDAWILRVGRILSWINALLIAVIMTQVVLRYAFGRGMTALEELEWHLYSLAFMLGLSYALVTDAHVRVDLLYERMSLRARHVVDLCGSLFVLLPFVVAVVLHAFDFVHDSWVHNERSSAPLGLPWRWLIKSVIPLAFIVLGVAALSRCLRCIAYLLGDRHGNE